MRIAKAEFKAMLREGFARRSDAPRASPLHLVPKKTEGWRPRGDYHALNARTIPHRYPVHHIQNFAHRIYGCHVCSVLELVKAYTQIPINPDDVPKTAIITPFGLFEFSFMSFGLRNAGQTFNASSTASSILTTYWSSPVTPTNTTRTFVYFYNASMTTAYSSMSQRARSALQSSNSSAMKFHQRGLDLCLNASETCKITHNR
ncbi:hypothetical protein V5799_025250 [Amblyomma americanum]|uniref:Reverse transcriptase domain-containing protein n=1 Tax=Amblyomma americanum TaxID=6943 RepID=A0AAQ4E9Z8_AMBAM